MSGHKPLSILVALLLLMLAGRIVADPGAEWESGSAAFATGNYADALSYFELARDGGLDSPAVHYNIAVCQYSLNEYEAARETFQLIARRFPSMQGTR
jgi:tetratricopeptide (TPR) repeat protein